MFKPGVHKFLKNLWSSSKFSVLGRWYEAVHAKDPQLFGATIQNLVSKTISHPGCVHPWFKHMEGLLFHFEMWCSQLKIIA
jgi:hypothetical protein